MLHLQMESDSLNEFMIKIITIPLKSLNLIPFDSEVAHFSLSKVL